MKSELIISSPAVRALSTAYIFARRLKYPLENIFIREKLFTDNYDDILKILKQFSIKISSVLLFGHNPSFEHLANYLSVTPVEKIHTRGVLCLMKSKFKNLEKYSMEIEFYMHPKKV